MPQKSLSDAVASVLGTPNTSYVPGNVDLYAQPKVKNNNGTISTVDSIGVNMDGKEYLLPTVTPDGRHFTGPTAAKQAEAEFKKTGRHLGIFADVASANRYAEQLHNDYAAGKYDARPTIDAAIANVLGSKEQPKSPQRLSVLEMGRTHVTSDDPAPEQGIIGRVVEMGRGMAEPHTLGDVVSLALPVKTGAVLDTAKTATKATMRGAGSTLTATAHVVDAAARSKTADVLSKSAAAFAALFGHLGPSAVLYKAPRIGRAVATGMEAAGEALTHGGARAVTQEAALPALTAAQRAAQIPLRERLAQIPLQDVSEAWQAAKEVVAKAPTLSPDSILSKEAIAARFAAKADDVSMVRALVSVGYKPETAIKVVSGGDKDYVPTLMKWWTESLRSKGAPIPSAALEAAGKVSPAVTDLMNSPTFKALTDALKDRTP